MRQAVSRLVQEGLLSTQRGLGTSVLERPETVASGPLRVGTATWPEQLEIDILYNKRTSVLPAEFRGP